MLNLNFIPYCLASVASVVAKPLLVQCTLAIIFHVFNQRKQCQSKKTIFQLCPMQDKSIHALTNLHQISIFPSFMSLASFFVVMPILLHISATSSSLYIATHKVFSHCLVLLQNAIPSYILSIYAGLLKQI